MALTVGELVGIIRADDSGWRAGIASARLRMRGLTRDAEGNLRDLRGRFISEGDAAGRGLADGIRGNAEVVVRVLKKIGPAAAGISVGLPAVAAMSAALGGLAAGAVSAGLAVGAFQAAVKPQMAMMQESAAAADKLAKAQENEARKKALAEKLKAQGSDLASKAAKAYTTARLATKDAEAAYQRQTAGMPKATRDAALAQAKLKVAHEEWSASLADTTMPVFTKGLDLLRSLLPTLTPFVKAAAQALGDMLDRVAVGVKGAKFKEWAADMAAASGTSLTNFIKVIGNLGKGFMGLMQAFLPTSIGVTGGLVSMTQAFADWGTSLKGSEGFAKFLEVASTGGTTLGQLALAVGNLLVALGPLIGITTQLALALAGIINALPPEVLSTLALAITAVVVAMKAYALYSRVSAAASDFMTTRLGIQARAWLTTARTAITSMASTARAAVVNAARTSAAWAGAALRSLGAFAAQAVRTAVTATAQFALMAARAVASAATTAAAWMGAALRSMATFAVQVVRTATVAVAQFALMAGRAIIWAATMAAQWLIAMGPIGWVIAAVIGLVALIVANWDKIKKYTRAAWDWVWQKLVGVGKAIVSFFQKWSILGTVVRHWENIRSGVAQKALALVAWLKGFPGRVVGALGNLGGLLVEKGRNVVQGLWRGIQSMGGWIRSQLMSWARNMIPGPIAKALGIASPSKVTKEQGRWIALGLVEGLTGSDKQVRAAALRLADIVRTSMKPGQRRTNALKRINVGTAALMTLANREAAVAAKLKVANQRLQDQIKARNELAASVRQGVLEAANITQNTDAGGTTATSVWANLQLRLRQATAFAAQLAALRKKGLRSDLIAQIAEAGVEQGSAAAAALANASKGQISQINATQAQLVAAATKAGNTAGDAMYGAGIQAAKGLVKGLQREQSAIERQMLLIAKGMQAAIRKALGIRSPSRVMAALGQYIPAGLVRGIESGRSAVDASMASLVTPPRPAAASAGAYGPAGTAAYGRSGQPIVIEFKSSGTPRGDYLVQELRQAVKAGGGDVQVVLGQRRR
ncbi:phage tail protein [Streptomyces sp. MSC1_001]|jgi:hypothetical protein|uniref:phage tail protein n=1 Tax=Streptomyces sp. MSC1_001 TaxID=2909263 RepID=UPI002030E066|nr:hypothetical protein [Streptomyces sp. MSC1_001]